MFRLAICDDDSVICDMIHQIVLAFDESPGIIISKYYTGESLCNDIQNGYKFDLIILDIELKTTNGVKIGKMLREDFQRTSTQILYISGKKEYAMELFDTRPLNFLIKPLEPQKIHKCLQQAINLCDRSAPYFEYTLRKILHRVAYRDICYLESKGKKVIIHTTEADQEAYIKLTDMVEQLPKPDFIMVHQSYIVNLTYIKTLQYDQLILDNDTILPISYPYRKLVREYIRKYSLMARGE